VTAGPLMNPRLFAWLHTEPGRRWRAWYEDDPTYAAAEWPGLDEVNGEDISHYIVREDYRELLERLLRLQDQQEETIGRLRALLDEAMLSIGNNELVESHLEHGYAILREIEEEAEGS
jgi:hypothetical protein